VKIDGEVALRLPVHTLGGTRFCTDIFNLKDYPAENDFAG
jgi:hypothetical protein